VQEAFAPNAIAKHVAERHEISTGLLFTWRRQLTASEPARFLPIQLTSSAEPEPPVPCPGMSSLGSIEVEMPNGARVPGSVPT
jgi:transposase